MKNDDTGAMTNCDMVDGLTISRKGATVLFFEKGKEKTQWFLAPPP